MQADLGFKLAEFEGKSLTISLESRQGYQHKIPEFGKLKPFVTRFALEKFQRRTQAHPYLDNKKVKSN